MFINFIKNLRRVLLRFRYPVSLPEDIANDLGIVSPYFLSLDDLIDKLVDPEYSPEKLKKFMSREEAEAVFGLACCKEKFTQNSLFSYYFNEGWLEFMLQFDEQARLRRMYVQHRKLVKDEGTEMMLEPLNLPSPPSLNRY